jgi:hypothetical protein
MRVLPTLALLILVPAAMGSQERPDLSGNWKLNRDQTAQAELRSAEDRAPVVGGRAPLGGGGPVGSPRTPGAGGSGDYARSRENPDEVAKAREAVRLAMLTPERLTIVQNASGFVVTDGQGATQKWTADGKTARSETGALTVDTKVKWDGRVLVVERKFEGDVKVTDQYSVAGSPRQLTISSKIEASKLPRDRTRTMQRVYELQ